MAGATGTLSATGDSEELHNRKGKGDFTYKLNFARTTGSLVYDLGFTEGGNVSYSLTGTWTGTVTLLRSVDKGQNYITVPGVSETSNTAKVIF